MPRTYTIETPRGKQVTIEADSPESATAGAQRWDLEDYATTEATRLGLSPETALRQMRQESQVNPNAVSRKGAIGPMQLMPETAKGLNVDPNDPYQNITGGLTYYKHLRDQFGGDETKALAAYNAGPGNVRKYGGVPPFKETQDYVAAIQNGAPAERVKASLVTAPPPAAPTAPVKPSQVSQRLGFEQGFAKPFENIGRFVRAGADKLGYEPAQWLQTAAKNLQAGQAQAEAAHPEVYKAQPGKLGTFAGNVGSTAWMPGGPLVSGALSGALLSDKKDLGGVVGDAALGGALGRAGAGVGDALQLGARRLLSKAAPKALDLPGLQEAKKALYKKVEQSGFTFAAPDVQKLATDFAAQVRVKGGPKAAQLIPAADAFAARLSALARQEGGVTLSQLDGLRSDIYQNLIEKGGAEASQGYALRKMIDGLMDSSSAPFIRAARIANTKFEKVSEVANRMQSAALAAGRANSGENVVNATRQKLSPMVDPMHSGQVKNLTPDEKTLLERIIAGDRTSNGLRSASKLLRNKFVSGPLAVMTGAGAGPWTGLGVMAGLEATGQGLRKGAEKYTKAQIQDLINLMSAGGSRQAVARVPTQASHSIEELIAALRPALATGGVAASSQAAAHPRQRK